MEIKDRVLLASVGTAGRILFFYPQYLRRGLLQARVGNFTTRNAMISMLMGMIRNYHPSLGPVAKNALCKSEVIKSGGSL